MRRELTALIASSLAACVSVNRVTVTPDQLHDLTGLAPGDERSFVPLDRSEHLVARGDDEVRLQLRPGKHTVVADTPWVQLCQLRWDPPYGFDPQGASGTISDGVIRVTAEDVKGAELQLARPDTLKTIALVAGIVLAVAVAAVLVTGAVVTASLSQTAATNVGAR